MGFKEDLIVEEEYFFDQTIVSNNCCDAAELYCHNVKPIAVQRQHVKEPVKAIDLKKPTERTPTTPNFSTTNRSIGNASFCISYGIGMNSLSDKFFKLGNVSEVITARERCLITIIKEEANALDDLTQRLNRLRQRATMRLTSTLNWS